MGTMLDGTLTYDWWIIDHTGHRWDIFGNAEGQDGVVMESISGAENTIEEQTSATSHQIGERITGRHTGALRPTLTVSINTEEHPASWEQWLAAWSQNRTNQLWCKAPRTNRRKHIDVKLRAGREDPDAEPHVSGLTIQPLELIAVDGLWVGDPVVLAAGETWTNPGDMPPLMVYRPAGAGQVSLQVGGDTWSAAHPQFPASTSVDLDPDARMKTRVGGVVDPTWFSTWRNKWNPLQVEEGQELTVAAAAGQVLVTPRFLGPW